MATSADVGTELRRVRLQRGMTIEDVAFAAGVNRRVVSELERGKPTVQFDIVLRIMTVLGLDLELRERS